MSAGLVDVSGQPLKAYKPRKQLGETQPRAIHARYDAARDTDEFKNYWANADSLDADSANSRGVRAKLVPRSRYEVENNGYTDGMVQTHCNYMVGTGPKLRMETQSPAFNKLVEQRWREWAKVIQLRRKLWCQAHAKIQDGEGFGIAATNLRLRSPVKLDYQLYETEQIQTPYEPYNEVGYIDGVHFDEFGNAIWYDVLPIHPGRHSYVGMNQEAESVPARFVCHWYKLRRPGQHRGVPEFRSTLTLGAGSRRWRESTQAAAETASQLGAALIKTQISPDDGPDLVAPLTSIDLQKRMMMALPMGWDAMQMKAEHPNATYRDFHRTQINEQGRPKSIPVNVGMADSSEHNFASGKLDHLSWFGEITVDRADGNDLVLDPLFDIWFEEARRVFDFVWSGDTPPHEWDWPVLPVADEKARSFARNMDLTNGSTTLSAVYSEIGQDFEQDVLPQMTQNYFGNQDESSIQSMRAILLQKNLGSVVQQSQEIDDADE